MGKYFTISELTKSDTAKKKFIDNTPNAAIKTNLEVLIEQLDKIREKWGSPIYVNSGYRCEKLNTAVKGVYNSRHMLGEAADLDTRKGLTENRKLYEFIIRNFDYDQCLLENGGQWVHYSFLRPNRKLKGSVTQR